MRINRRLTFTEQAAMNPVNRGRRLAIELTGTQGEGTRVRELLAAIPSLLALKGIMKDPPEIKCLTPMDHYIDPAQLIGKTPAQIDQLAKEIDGQFPMPGLRLRGSLITRRLSGK